MGKKLTLTTHHLTETALARLSALAPGETVTWEELSGLLGTDPRQEGRTYLRSARRILRRRRVVIYALAGVGLQRLTDEQIADVVPPSRRRKIRRQAQRQVSELQAADLGKLSRHRQAAVTAALANAGTILHCTNFHFTQVQQRRIELNVPPPSPSPIGG